VAQVQVHGAVGRGHGLLEQQQALQQRGLARGVAAQQHGDGRQPHRPAVVPGLDVAQVEVVDHGVFLSVFGLWRLLDKRE